MKNKNLILTAIAVIIVGAGAFFAGMKYRQSKQPSRVNFQARMGIGQDNISGAGQRAGTRVIRGEIISQDAESITVKLPDGSSKIVLISEISWSKCSPLMEITVPPL